MNKSDESKRIDYFPDHEATIAALEEQALMNETEFSPDYMIE